MHPSQCSIVYRSLFIWSDSLLLPVYDFFDKEENNWRNYFDVLLNGMLVDPLLRGRFSKASLKSRLKKV